MAVAPNSATLRQIDLAVRQLLVAKTELDESKLFNHLPGMDYPDGVDEEFITLSYSSPKPVHYDPGAGRLARVVARVLTVGLHTRENFLDEPFEADIALLDEETPTNKSHSTYEELILDALELKNLFDVDFPSQSHETLLTRQPVRLVEGGEQPHVPKGRQGWIVSTFPFEVQYNSPLTKDSNSGI